MPTDEPRLLAKWVTDTLTADATITAAVATRVYNRQATQSTDYPNLVYTITPVQGDRTLGARMWSNFILDVKLINKGNSFTTYAAASAVIDSLLSDKTNVAVTGGTIKHCIHQMPIEYDETNNGIRYTHQGHSFLVGVKAS